MTDTGVLIRRLPPASLDGLLAGCALACVVGGLLSAGTIDLSRVDDRGLAPLVPVGFWIALLGLNSAFVVALGRRSVWLIAVLVGSLILLLGGLGALASDVPRNSVAWRHLGIADSLSQGILDPQIDVYFNWPGFFAGLATFIGSTGVAPLAVAQWAPVLNIALWALAVLVVLRSLTADRTLVWLGLWLFLLGNWIDQDYLSPQALGLFLHLAVLAIVLSVLGARVEGGSGLGSLWRRGRRERLVPETDDERTRAAMFGMVLLLAVAIVASHQLTPVMLVVTLAALVVVRSSWAPLLPVIIGLVLVLWLLYPASTYLAGHPIVGRADGGVLQANLSDRVVGSSGHLEVQVVRMSIVAGLWLLAAWGAFRAHRAGRTDLRVLALVAAPFLLLPTQSYGGEMLLRVTLFTLPMAISRPVVLPAGRANTDTEPGLRRSRCLDRWASCSSCCSWPPRSPPSQPATATRGSTSSRRER